MDNINPFALNPEQIELVHAAISFLIIVAIIVVLGSIVIAYLKNSAD
jgi:hypothetical protein